MNHAQKGARRERQSRELLEREGFLVIRSAASKSPFDLVAIKADSIVLLQCKANRPPSPAERAAMLAVPVPDICRRVVHVWRDGEGEPRVTEL